MPSVRKCNILNIRNLSRCCEYRCSCSLVKQADACPYQWYVHMTHHPRMEMVDADGDATTAELHLISLVRTPVMPSFILEVDHLLDISCVLPKPKRMQYHQPLFSTSKAAQLCKPNWNRRAASKHIATDNHIAMIMYVSAPFRNFPSGSWAIHSSTNFGNSG